MVVPRNFQDFLQVLSEVLVENIVFPDNKVY
jgi:hypothetical protein